MEEQSNKLAVLEHAERLLKEIRTVDDARHLAARAEAARAYAKEIKAGLEVQNYAAEIKLRAQREAGRVLDEMKKRGELYDSTASGEVSAARLRGIVFLADLGVDRHESKLWQYFYRLPQHVFEEGIDKFWQDERELTTFGLFTWGKSYGKPPKEETKKVMTNAVAFKEIKEMALAIKERVNFIKSSANNGGGKEAKYYLRAVIDILTEIAVGLVKEGFDYDPGV